MRRLKELAEGRDGVEIRDFRLGEWLVRPESCELIGPDGPRQLKPRTIEVLQHLARHAGEVRSREEVLCAVWGDAFVGEEVLSHCVWELRRALGDDSRNPRFIQTVHRKGYKLIAPVSWLETEPAIGGRYRLGDRIGGGTMGVVYEAEDLRLRRPVALKFLPPELSRVPEAKDRFLREARLAAALDHPNLCTLYEVDETEDGQLFLVMPRYRGEALKQRLSRGPLPWAEAVDVARQIARGLAAAHGAGVVHRDVKPSNVFLTADGRAKLIDFGVAKLADATKYTTEGSSRGTPAYMSPEQTEGRPADPRTDLWSLGVLLYEALTGERPFPGDNDAVVIYGIRSCEPEPLGERCPAAPETVVRLVEALLRKDREERPAKAAAVLAALDEPAATPTPPASEATGMLHGAEGLKLLRKRVQRFWIDQALTNSLSGAEPYRLDLVPRPEAVDHPWGELRPAEEETLAAVPPDEPLTTTLRRFGGTVLILGESGSGKTVTLLRLARQAVELSRRDPAEPVPVVLQLASWADRAASLERWLEEEISRRYYVPRSAGRTWIREGVLMLLLDGLDEIEADRRAKCVAALNRFHEAMPLVPLAVTCRSEDYQNLIREGARLALAGALAVEPLTEEQVAAALAEAPDLRQRVARDRSLGELARSPLVLSILRRFGLGDPASGGEPSEADRDRLLYRYVRGSLRGQGKAYPPYSERQVVGWLASLARSLLGHHRSLFQLEEIQPSWLRTPWRRWAYVLLSRIGISLCLALAFSSMVWVARSPEAIPVIVLNGAVAGVMVALLDLALFARRGTVSEGGAWSYPLLVAMASAAAMVSLQPLLMPSQSPIGPVLFAVCLAILLRRRFGEVRWPTDVGVVETFRWSWRGALRGLVAATAVLWILTTIVGVAKGGLALPADLFSTLPNNVVGGLIAAQLIGLRRGFLDVKTRPNHGMWLSARNAALAAALLFAGTFLALSLARLLAMQGLLAPTHLVNETGVRLGPRLGWGLSTALALLGALALGGVDLIKHFVLRGLLWTEGTAPARYPRFLTYAARCTLLRRAGGGYVFAHRSLQEYFASLGTSVGTESV